MARLRCGIGLAAMLAALFGASCGGAEDVPVSPAGPPEDVLLWTVDAHGSPSTYWIRGNAIGGKILAKRPGIAISLPEGLFEVASRELALPTCDCAAEPAEDAGAGEDCPAVVEAGARGTVLVVVRHPSGEETPISTAPRSEDARGPLYEALEFGSAATASLGPFLFARTDTRSMACGAAHDDWWAESAVHDIISGERVELLSAEEKAELLTHEQKAAFRLFGGDTLIDAKGPEDLELTAIEPIVAGSGLSVRYQFSARSSFAASDGAFGAYTRSVDVPAARVPAALTPFTAIPKPLYRFPLPSGEAAVGGFSVVVTDPAQRAALADLFSAEL